MTFHTSKSLRPGGPKFQVYTRRDIDRIPQLQSLGRSSLLDMKAVSAVLPFRVNPYVVEQLIDWDAVPDDPLFQLTFPHPGMLDDEDFQHMRSLVATGASDKQLQFHAEVVRSKLNPHPAGQMDLNVPQLNGTPLLGAQHKYAETVLFFPSQGQTCHAYCSYCFRWAQFLGDADLTFASRDVDRMVEYVRHHPDVRSILFTGGDPLTMSAKVLRRYIQPFLSPEFAHLESIRIGTKSLAYWPYRFVTDPDADELLALFEEVTNSSKNLAFMAHISHSRELDTSISKQAIRRVQSTGATIRCQAPLIQHVNDNYNAWADMWKAEVRFGMVPYYMFVERDTGAKRYFQVPLYKAVGIFNEAYRQVSGLAKTVRGPVMSTTPGKVLLDGTAHIQGQDVFVLKFLQARNSNLVGKPFFAKMDATATWWTDLVPFQPEDVMFFA